MSRRARFLRRFSDDRRGVAAVESALITGVFVTALFNAVDVGRYAYVVMEVEQATQAGAQAALVACDDNHVPATQNCPTLNSAVTTAIQGTSLGSQVSLNGAITEGYYCLNGTALALAGSINNKPADCSAFGGSGLTPALYLQVHTSYSYSPIFGSFSVAHTFPTPITKTAWMRMD